MAALPKDYPRPTSPTIQWPGNITMGPKDVPRDTWDQIIAGTWTTPTRERPTGPSPQSRSMWDNDLPGDDWYEQPPPQSPINMGSPGYTEAQPTTPGTTPSGDTSWVQALGESQADFEKRMMEQLNKLQQPKSTPISPPRLTGQTTMPIKPGVPMPTLSIPERDEGRVAELRSKYMYPQRRLRQELRRGMTDVRNISDPTVRREVSRGLIEGFGAGLSEISGRAGIEAENTYARERAEEIRVLEVNFQAAMNDYMAQWGQETTMQYGAADPKKPVGIPEDAQWNEWKQRWEA